MCPPLEQHQLEIQGNRAAWERKPLLQQVYRGFYQRILSCLDPAAPGLTVEIGSGIGNLKTHYPVALATDLFANPWLDLVCDAYELPFPNASVSHLILFDVFHHLRAPRAFLREARRVLSPAGRVLLFEPYMSLISLPVYGLLHHEPVAWGEQIDMADALPRPRDYYAAQGNATRLFFRGAYPDWLQDWEVIHREAFASFAYLLSGGFSKPAFYPSSWLTAVQAADRWLSRRPVLFGARCLLALRQRPR